MKNLFKGEKKQTIFLLLFLTFVLFLSISSLVAYYFYKLEPTIKSLTSQLNETESKLKSYDNISKDKTNCNLVREEGTFKYICHEPETKSEALSICANKANNVDSLLSSKITFAEFNKYRDLSMKMCMEAYGFEY